MNILNEFEIAILEFMVSEGQPLKCVIDNLRVRDRTYTSCGVYVDFLVPVENLNSNSQSIGFCSEINIPNISQALQADLTAQDGYPSSLEIVTLGGESWNGTHEGFQIETNT